MTNNKQKIAGLKWSDNIGRAKDEVELTCTDKDNETSTEYCVWMVGVVAKDPKGNESNQYEVLAWKGKYHRVLNEMVRSWQAV